MSEDKLQRLLDLMVDVNGECEYVESAKSDKERHICICQIKALIDEAMRIISNELSKTVPILL